MDQQQHSSSPFVLALDSPEASLALVGGKGASLARLVREGFPVPPGFILTTHAYRRFVQANALQPLIQAALASLTPDSPPDPTALETVSHTIRTHFTRSPIPPSLSQEILAAHAHLSQQPTPTPNPPSAQSLNPPLAVRSSATAEDLPDLSFAGQQETYLNVVGEAALLEAVVLCWSSLWTARAIGYRQRNAIPADEVALAVVVQLLVPAEAAGILFTANPLTGDRSQVVINAAWGLGEAVVGGAVTPDTYEVEKTTGRLLTRQIADKQVMTMRVDGGTQEQTVPEALRERPVLDVTAVGELARLGGRIETLYGMPMDVEWAWDPGGFSILQARPITALPEAQPVVEWSLPQEGGSYWRASVIELLPDPLSPLFASLALPAWNTAYHRLFGSLGRPGTFQHIFQEQMLVTINQYAYYDYSFTSGQYLRFGLGLLLNARQAYGWMKRGESRWADEARPEYAAVTSRWAAVDPTAVPSTYLLEGMREITAAAANHYTTIQSGIIPLATLSELVFSTVYNRFLKTKEDPPALIFLLGFDSVPILAEKSLYDLAVWAAAQEGREPGLVDYLTRSSGAEIAARLQSGASPIANTAAWEGFSRRFADHLQRFGHTIYDLDFAKSVPADDPAPLLDTTKYFLLGQGRNPHERQAADIARREQAMQSLQARLRGLRLRWFKKLAAWAQEYAPLREDALADVGLGWPVLRRMVHEIGRRLAEARVLSDPGLVFWLREEEVEAAAARLDAAGEIPDFRILAAERRQHWESLRKVIPPVTLPVKGGGRFFGIDFSRWMPARSQQAEGSSIQGIGASPGCVSGTARVIHDPWEFSTMQPGDILVAKITTPAWTPLFTLAAGVVTDVGGPLSHSSIVAREYHIPAVLGTGVATERIHSGQRISVDGDAGVVTLSD